MPLPVLGYQVRAVTVILRSLSVEEDPAVQGPGGAEPGRGPRACESGSHALSPPACAVLVHCAGHCWGLCGQTQAVLSEHRAHAAMGSSPWIRWEPRRWKAGVCTLGLSVEMERCSQGAPEEWVPTTE